MEKPFRFVIQEETCLRMAESFGLEVFQEDSHTPSSLPMTYLSPHHWEIVFKLSSVVSSFVTLGYTELLNIIPLTGYVHKSDFIALIITCVFGFGRAKN